MNMRLKYDLLASFMGKGCNAFLLLLFTPFFISLLGIESYGLIGVFNSLVILFSLFDLGFGAALNRAFARQEEKSSMGDLLKTLEFFFWGISLLLALMLFFLSDFLAHHWLVGTVFSAKELRFLLILMGFSLLFQLPFSLYCNALLGLHKQILLNIALVATTALRYVGAMVLLKWADATLTCFFSWQLGVSLFQTLLLKYLVKKEIGQKGTFQKQLMLQLLPFALGIGSIAITGLLLNHIDKIILSKMVPLRSFGYYTLATSCSNGLYVFFAPLFAVFFPRFSQLVSRGDQEGLKNLYHRSCQLLSVIILPLALALCLFSEEILYYWTKDAVAATESAPLVSLLILGTALHGLMQMPFALQYAHGWTRLILIQNIVGLVLLVPLMIWAVALFGVKGGPLAWVLLNCVYLAIGMHFMHRKLLPTEKLHWYVKDVGWPLLAALTIFLPVKFFFPPTMIFSLILIVLGAIMAAFLATPLRRTVKG
jgi:O-antigen/teichoic acid export membrane protein